MSASTARRTLIQLMLKGGVGPLTSSIPLFVLPLAGAAALPSREFAIWSILASISTLSLSLDFGGLSYLTSALDSRTRSVVVVRASALSAMGSLLVGLIGCLAWIPYSRTGAASAISLLGGLGCIALITTGSAARSVVQVFAQVALFDRQFSIRNVMLLAHSITASLVTIALLIATPSPWALPLGWAAGGAVGLLAGCAAKPWSARGSSDFELDSAGRPSASTYAWSRTASGVLGGVLMQGDRWIVGLVGGPVLLASYEVAWRIASLPRFVTQNLVFVSGVDAARTRAQSPAAANQLLRHSVQTSIALILVGSGAAVVVYWGCNYATPIPVEWAAFGFLLMSHGALGAFSPVSFMGSALGLPKIDLPYLSVALLSSAAVAAVAVFTRSPYWFIGGSSLAVALTSGWFYHYGTSAIRNAL